MHIIIDQINQFVFPNFNFTYVLLTKYELSINILVNQ